MRVTRRNSVMCFLVHCTDNMILILMSSFMANALCDVTDGGKAPRMPMNDGNSMPIIGLGTFLGFDENGLRDVLPHEVENSVTWALSAGYRLIDTAAVYNTEGQIGVAVRASPTPREHVFIVTKLALNEQRIPLTSLKNSLARLNMSYVDLYLIHNPVAFKPDNIEFDVVDYLDTWKGMEEAKRLGLTKSIGISNFNSSQIERLLANCEIKPSVLQVEVNLNMAQKKLIEFSKEHNIVVMAYTPFGSLFGREPKAPPPRADHPTLVGIGNKYMKTTPQVVLRYLIQRNVIPIPKSLHKHRIDQNIDVFDFELSPQEMDELGEFNKDYRLVGIDFLQDHPYYAFERKGKLSSNPPGSQYDHQFTSSRKSHRNINSNNNK